VKTLLSALVMVALCACAKHIDVQAPQKSLSASAFASMLTRNSTYTVSEYYTTDSALNVPVVNSDDTYTFDGGSGDGWISSKFPCIEYHYNFNVFTSGDHILFNWLDFSIAAQTFEVSDYSEDEWFILKKGDTYTKYVLIHPGE
jgi:hypothetical protein